MSKGSFNEITLYDVVVDVRVSTNPADIEQLRYLGLFVLGCAAATLRKNSNSLPYSKALLQKNKDDNIQKSKDQHIIQSNIQL